MRNLTCKVTGFDLFSRELLLNFINKTPGLSLSSDESIEVDIMFVDADLNKNDFFQDDRLRIILVSSDLNHIHSLFQNHVSDYLYKPELSYARFQTAIEKVREKIMQQFL